MEWTWRRFARLLDEFASLPAEVVESMIVRSNTIVENPDNVRRMADHLLEFGTPGPDGEYAFSRFAENSLGSHIDGVDQELFGLVIICAYYCACAGYVPEGKIPHTATFDAFGLLLQIYEVFRAAEWAYKMGYTRRADRAELWR